MQPEEKPVNSQHAEPQGRPGEGEPRPEAPQPVPEGAPSEAQPEAPDTTPEEAPNEAQPEAADKAPEEAPKATPVRKRRRWLWLLAALLAIALGGECVQRWRIERAVSAALDRLERPYVLGAVGPDAYDCSSLVQYCFGEAGLRTPRLAVDIGYWDRCPTIEDREKLLRGDVVCFDTVDDSDLSDHVGIYLGNNHFVHASSGKGRVVVSELTGYYADHFSWGKRLIRHAPLELLLPAADAQ